MRIFRAILYSLAIHLVLLVLLRAAPSEWAFGETPAPNVAEIELVSNPPKDDDSGRVVREAPAPEKMLIDSKDPARFRSAEDQRVLQETRARRTGLTRNGKALPEPSWMKTYRERHPAGSEQARRDLPADGTMAIPLPKPGHEPSIAFEDAPSTVGEVLPNDVSLGDFTALNTDRFKYYSFYSRIEELVRFRWERGLQQAIQSFDRRFLLNTIGRKTWVTRAEFWITPEGRLHSVHVFRESGVRSFDMAAINAFRDAAVFPNPPAEMVEKDGFIRVQYSFNVHWSPSVMAGSSDD